MATISLKKNFVIKDKKVLKQLKYAFEHPTELNAKKIDWETENKRRKEALTLLRSLSKK